MSLRWAQRAGRRAFRVRAFQRQTKQHQCCDRFGLNPIGWGRGPRVSVASLGRKDSHVDKTESRRISRFFQGIGAVITNLFLNRGHKVAGTSQ
jgi:hypothetical protein